MKAALIALVVTVATPMHLHLAILGAPVSVTVGVLILAAEALTTVGLGCLIVRALRESRRPAFTRANRSTS